VCTATSHTTAVTNRLLARQLLRRDARPAEPPADHLLTRRAYDRAQLRVFALDDRAQPPVRTPHAIQRAVVPDVKEQALGHAYGFDGPSVHTKGQQPPFVEFFRSTE
jgi:hypothetical protein